MRTCTQCQDVKVNPTARQPDTPSFTERGSPSEPSSSRPSDEFVVIRGTASRSPRWSRRPALGQHARPRLHDASRAAATASRHRRQIAEPVDDVAVLDVGVDDRHRVADVLAAPDRRALGMATSSSTPTPPTPPATQASASKTHRHFRHRHRPPPHLRVTCPSLEPRPAGQLRVLHQPARGPRDGLAARLIVSTDRPTFPSRCPSGPNAAA